MMVSVGLLDPELSPADRFSTDTVEPVRPGTDSANMMKSARSQREKAVLEAAAARLLAETEAERDEAVASVDAHRTCITLTRLSYAHLSLGETDAGLMAARECVELALAKASEAGVVAPKDVTSLRMAVEVLRDNDDARFAYERLVSLPGVTTSRTLTVALATLANELGDPQQALDILQDQDGPLVESFKGYLLAMLGESQKAIAHLRAALAEHPDDADAAMNLAVMLWVIGAKRKGLKSALRATRTAPGRKDLSLRYLELLLEIDDIERATSEIARINGAGVVPDARFLVIQARVQLAQDQKSKALSLLDEAYAAVQTENDPAMEGEIAANRETLRYDLGRVSRGAARQALGKLLDQFPANDVVLVSYCYLTRRRSESARLRRAFLDRESEMAVGRRQYVRHCLALLDGDANMAADSAVDWFDNAKDNPAAAAAALTSLGIGAQRWDEAVKVAEYALTLHAGDTTVLNNAAYTLAMTGRADEAKRLLTPFVGKSFVLRATLGLAHLAGGEIEEGFRLYRQAADLADASDKQVRIKDSTDDASRCLMTLYEAMVVRQLGLDKTVEPAMLTALSLPPVPLPYDWEDRPEFLRLHNVCVQNGYDWPVTL